MRSHYKIRNTLKNLLFYSEEINNLKINNKNIINARSLSELPPFSKSTKKLSSYELPKKLPFFPKRPKTLTKQQILKNILPLYDRVGISNRQGAFRSCAETYNVEIVDRKSFSDSLFLLRS